MSSTNNVMIVNEPITIDNAWEAAIYLDSLLEVDNPITSKDAWERAIYLDLLNEIPNRIPLIRCVGCKIA